ncbi:MAG: hypothetical protein K0Q46_958 [Rhodococcus erythropolis]|nr:hypothetical protein [Rhodococcus erythropolis]
MCPGWNGAPSCLCTTGLLESSIPMFSGRCVQQPIHLAPSLVVPGVGNSLQLAHVDGHHRAPSEQEPSVHRSLVQQLTQLTDVTGCVREVGQPVQPWTNSSTTFKFSFPVAIPW